MVHFVSPFTQRLMARQIETAGQLNESSNSLTKCSVGFYATHQLTKPSFGLSDLPSHQELCELFVFTAMNKKKVEI